MSEASARLIMRSSDASACFAQVKMAPPAVALFADLPAASLEPSDFLTDDRGQLVPLARSIFDTLSSATSMVRLQNLERGSDLVIETCFFASDADGPYASVARQPENDICDLAMIGMRDALLATLDMMLAISDQPAEIEPFAVGFDLPTLGLLAAMTDLIGYEQARSQVHDEGFDAGLFSGPLPLGALRDWIAAEQSKPDKRSFLSQLNFLSHGALLAGSAQAVVCEGYAAMQARGLIDDEDAPTPALLSLIAMLYNCSRVTALTRTGPADDDGAKLDTVMLLHAGDQTFLGLWQLDEDARPIAFRIIATDGSGLLSAMDAFLAGKPATDKTESAPVLEDRFCAECGAEHAPGQRFCKACGASLT